jgi:AmiR/NasT family two-component response regulator
MIQLKRPDFENRRLLLLDCEERSLAQLRKSLQRLGIRTVEVHGDTALPDDCFAAIVELDHFASPAVLASLGEQGLPVIALTSHESLSHIQRALCLGATALLNKPITQGSVYTTVMMALALRERLSADAKEIEQLRERLNRRPLLAKAIARLMVEQGVDEATAYERLRSLSMSLNRSVDELCKDMLADRISNAGGRS